MSWSKTLYPLLSTGSTQEDPYRHDCQNVDFGCKESNQTKSLDPDHSVCPDLDPNSLIVFLTVYFLKKS